MYSFGDWLYEKRRKLKASPEECAEAASISVEEWRDIEQDETSSILISPHMPEIVPRLAAAVFATNEEALSALTLVANAHHDEKLWWMLNDLNRWEISDIIHKASLDLRAVLKELAEGH